ncbi:(R)-mandelonitrile lyase [Shimia sp. MMG029]|uniref:(R)-mandelonitrile lyase n=1 Tax=Shimia sp. MMG029 TaxID=3021978 RepID=UPI0022FE9187|nr:cupin domain-containing protein [Shimia sp. MMG029]MDA5556625.1 cupin domain-containing protein [Shimia sp. MMG029]
MIDHIPAGQVPSRAGTPEYFTGTVRLDLITESRAPSELFAARVTFEPGARTAWHTHPVGQTLHVLSGVGLIALRGEAPRTIRPGDTIWIEPGVEHWHGATPDTGMCHLAMQQVQDGSGADWLEHVTDTDYLLPPAE